MIPLSQTRDPRRKVGFCHIVGGVISPVLANMTLDGLEHLIRERFNRCWIGKDGQSRWRPKEKPSKRVYLIRYADDFVVTGTSREVLENEVIPMVRDFLAERGLTLSEEKTVVMPIEEGVDFLGINIRRYDGALLTKPSKKSVKRLLDRIREIVSSGRIKGGNACKLIDCLNPILLGWANYHRYGASKRTFVRIDHEVWKCLWRWAQRRHPRKRKQWLKDRYFVRVGGQDWVFCDTRVDREQHLFRMARMPIRRHVKVQQDANPFDPAWRDYFAQRKRKNWRPA